METLTQVSVHLPWCVNSHLKQTRGLGRWRSLQLQNNEQVLQVYSTGSPTSAGKQRVQKTQEIKSDHTLKAHVLWSPDQNHMLKPCLPVDVYACVCAPTHSHGLENTGMGSEQERYRWLCSPRQAPPQYPDMSAVSSWQYIPSYFVRETSTSHHHEPQITSPISQNAFKHARDELAAFN